MRCDGETFRGQRWCEGARPRRARGSWRHSVPWGEPGGRGGAHGGGVTARHPGAPRGERGCRLLRPRIPLPFLSSVLTDPNGRIRIPHKSHRLQASRCWKKRTRSGKKCERGDGTRPISPRRTLSPGSALGPPLALLAALGRDSADTRCVDLRHGSPPVPHVFK